MNMDSLIVDKFSVKIVYNTNLICKINLIDVYFRSRVPLLMVVTPTTPMTWMFLFLILLQILMKLSRLDIR